MHNVCIVGHTVHAVVRTGMTGVCLRLALMVVECVFLEGVGILSVSVPLFCIYTYGCVGGSGEITRCIKCASNGDTSVHKNTTQI